jgi:tetratricopeptide (TPR) repeat protein
MMKSVIKVLLLLVICFGFLTGQSFPQNKRIANQDRLAKSYLARGQFEEAQKIYSDLHHQQPHNFQFYQSLFKILVSQKKYEEAVELTQNQLKISKSKVNLYGDLGSVYFLMGNEQKANEIWEDALKLEPQNAFTYRTIADYMFENRIIERAIDVLRMGNEVADDKTIFSYDIANFYSLTMKYEEATKEYCKILLQKPKQLNLIKNKIISYINANQATEPTLLTVEKLFQDVENITILQLLAELYSRTNNREKALRAIIQIEEKTTRNGSAIFAFAQQSTRIGDHKIAADAYNKIISDYPKSALFAEAEIGYTRSLESDLNILSLYRESWKPLILQDSENQEEYTDLLNAYNSLVEKYPDSKVGFEAEYRMAKILCDNLNNLKKSDSIFISIIAEVKSLQYINDSYFGLAQIAIKSGELITAENYLLKIKESRMSNAALKSNSDFLLAKIKMWGGKFSESIEMLNKVTENPKDENVNDALHYLLIINTLKNDSINLFSFFYADYLLEKKKFDESANEFRKLADNADLFLLKDFAALRYVELQLALNNYKEATIFLEEVLKSDENHIYKDRFLYLLGSNYYYGLHEGVKALDSLTRIFDEFPNSIYFNKARKIIAEINDGVKNSI